MEMEGGGGNAISNDVGVGKTAHPRTVDFSPRPLQTSAQFKRIYDHIPEHLRRNPGG